MHGYIPPISYVSPHNSTYKQCTSRTDTYAESTSFFCHRVGSKLHYGIRKCCFQIPISLNFYSVYKFETYNAQ